MNIDLKFTIKHITRRMQDIVEQAREQSEHVPNFVAG